MLKHSLSLSLFSLLLVLLFSVNALAKVHGDEVPCTSVYTPATAGYDFTAAIDHWGQEKIRYDFNGKEKVGHIYINSLPIFDTTNPAEDNFLYRWINEIHPGTHPYVIRDLILFKEGGPITNHSIAESERILRQQRFTSDASIRVVSDCHNVVDVEVITKEVWTLLPDVSLGTAGGKSEFSLGVHDSNFLGTGSLLTLRYSHSVDRNTVLTEYQNANVRGSRISLLTHIEQNSDGYVRRLQVDLPFYELNAKQSWGVAAAESRQAEHQYRRGDTVASIDTRNQHFETWFGVSPGLVGNWANRYIFGLAYDNTSYAPLAGEIVPSPVPTGAELVYPYVEFQQVENRYKVAYNINQINREEDIHVGRSLRARFGYSQIGAPRIILNGNFAGTLVSRNKELFQANVSWDGRWNFASNRAEDARVALSLDYHHGQSAKRSLHFQLKLVDTWNASPQQQAILGGATGLRGYPVHYAAGDLSYRFTAEQQFFTNYSVFSLYNVGFVAFMDTGRVRYKNNRGIDDGQLTDVGFGVRFVPTKTDKDRVIHIDVGWPLRQRPGAHGVQIMVAVEKTI